MKTIEKVYQELSDWKHLLATDGRMPSEARMPKARPVAIAMERQKTVKAALVPSLALAALVHPWPAEVRIIEGLPALPVLSGAEVSEASHLAGRNVEGNK